MINKEEQRYSDTKFNRYFQNKKMENIERERNIRQILFKSINKRRKVISNNSQLNGIKINLHSKPTRIIPMNNQRIMRKNDKISFWR